MANIDELLDGLRGMDSDPRLATMDIAVMAGVAAHREKSAARRGLVLTSVLALGVGLVTSALAPQSVLAERSVSLNAVPPSAPSSLLMGTH